MCYAELAFPMVRFNEAGCPRSKYLIEREHLTRHLSTIIQSHPHAIIDLPRVSAPKPAKPHESIAL